MKFKQSLAILTLISATIMLAACAGTTPPPSDAAQTPPAAAAPDSNSPAPDANQGAIAQNGYQGYYIVRSDDSAGDTGDKVCARAGKQCVGYTALNTSVCKAYHPDATVVSDLDGSKAGFFCNGAPQGGVCGREMNTCHICRDCNLNMDCARVIGDLYRETFVECK